MAFWINGGDALDVPYEFQLKYEIPPYNCLKYVKQYLWSGGYYKMVSEIFISCYELSFEEVAKWH